MKSIIILCTPKECEKIANGDLTILVRKTAPKEKPFKAYIYCKKDGFGIYGDSKYYVTDYMCILNQNMQKGFEETSGLFKWNGKIIGSFVCNKLYNLRPSMQDYDFTEIYKDNESSEFFSLKKTGLTQTEIYELGKGKKLYGLHITEREFYHKPKELSVFRRPLICLEKVRTYNQDLGYDCSVCDGCMYAYWDKKHFVKCSNLNCRYANLSTVQGAWQYVEEI